MKSARKRSRAGLPPLERLRSPCQSLRIPLSRADYAQDEAHECLHLDAAGRLGLEETVKLAGERLAVLRRRVEVGVDLRVTQVVSRRGNVASTASPSWATHEVCLFLEDEDEEGRLECHGERDKRETSEEESDSCDKQAKRSTTAQRRK